MRITVGLWWVLLDLQREASMEKNTVRLICQFKHLWCVRPASRKMLRTLKWSLWKINSVNGLFQNCEPVWKYTCSICSLLTCASGECCLSSLWSRETVWAELVTTFTYCTKVPVLLWQCADLRGRKVILVHCCTSTPVSPPFDGSAVAHSGQIEAAHVDKLPAGLS